MNRVKWVKEPAVSIEETKLHGVTHPMRQNLYDKGKYGHV